MRKLLKFLLPPFVGFAAYFLAVRYSPFYFSLRIDEIGEGTVQGFMAYYRYALPLLFLVAVLTQALIIVPIWDRVIHRSAVGKLISFLSLCLICLGFAAGISYIIWDRQKGTEHLIGSCVFLAGVQLGYWMINFLILLLLTVRTSRSAKAADENASASE